jgi:hypothetical protein
MPILHDSSFLKLNSSLVDLFLHHIPCFCVVSFLWLQQTPEINQLKKRKGLFWITVLEVPVHGQLASLLFGLGHCSPSWQEHMAEEAHSCQGQEWKRGIRVSLSPSSCAPGTRSPPTGPHLLNVLLPPNSVKLGSKPLTHGLWEIFMIQTIVAALYIHLSTYSLVFQYLGYCEKRYTEHGSRVIFMSWRFPFFWVYTQKRDCRVIGSYLLISLETTFCFLQWLY